MASLPYPENYEVPHGPRTLAVWRGPNPTMAPFSHPLEQNTAALISLFRRAPMHIYLYTEMGVGCLTSIGGKGSRDA